MFRLDKFGRVVGRMSRTRLEAVAAVAAAEQLHLSTSNASNARKSVKTPVGPAGLVVHVPSCVLDPEAFERAVADGTSRVGDIVWPSSVALAELLATGGPRLARLGLDFTDKRVLELGSGLGLAGMSVAMSAAPSSVTLTNHDLEALMLAEQSAKGNGLAKVSARPLGALNASRSPSIPRREPSSLL